MKDIVLLVSLILFFGGIGYLVAKVFLAGNALSKTIDRIDRPEIVEPQVASVQDKNLEDIRLAALINLGNYPSMNRNFPQSESRCVQAQEWLEDKRKWVKTLSDRKVRDAYEYWLVWIEHNIKASREENRTQAEAIRTKRYWDEYDEQKKRARDLRIPSPSDRR
jgi:hypothetical protein